MTITGEYEPGTWDWVAKQIEEYEASGGTRANTLRDTGIPIIVVTMRGAKSRKVRKIGLMRVEHDGSYALVASKGGDAAHPAWYHNITADPRVLIQDGPGPQEFVVREVDGDERAAWWERAAAVYPPYLEYAMKAGRVIPVLVANPS
jgi:deazaflavin-dependent oxidoreductase (nitroreductase family)